MEDKPSDFTIEIAPSEAEKNAHAFRESVAILKDTLSVQIEYTQLKAKLDRTRYVALIEEGFSEQQTLFLCK